MSSDRLFPIKMPETCFFWYPRKGEPCTKNPDFVADYSSGVGACTAHAGDLVKWCLEHDGSVEIYTTEMWLWKIDKESQD